MEYEALKGLIKSGNLIAAIFGSAIAMFFSKKPTTLRDWVRSVFAFLFGVAATSFLTPFIIFYCNNKDIEWIVDIEYSVAFIVGLLSMGIIELILTLLNRLITMGIIDIILNSLKRLITNPKQAFEVIRDFLPFFKK